MQNNYCEFDPVAYITNKQNILNAIEECLADDNIDGIIEVLQTYIETKNALKKANKKTSRKATNIITHRSLGNSHQTNAKFAQGRSKAAKKFD